VEPDLFDEEELVDRQVRGEHPLVARAVLELGQPAGSVGRELRPSKNGWAASSSVATSVSPISSSAICAVSDHYRLEREAGRLAGCGFIA